MLFQPFFPLKLVIIAISCNKQTSKRINALSMTAVITFWPTEIDLRRNIKEFYAFTVVILKMAAIFVMGRICDGPISKNQYRGIVYLHTKFHACIIKPTILPPICWTNLTWKSFQVKCFYSCSSQKKPTTQKPKGFEGQFGQLDPRTAQFQFWQYYFL